MTTVTEGDRPWTSRAGEPDTAALLADLTPPQREAVLHAHGPLLILAAAGSGKTRVITRRIAYLIATGAAPWSILAVTFTNKAAGEMRERVLHLVGGPEARGARGLTITTFHALCARLLRRYAEPAGLRPEFAILDSDAQTALCKKALESLGLSSTNFPPRSVLSAISRAKNELQDAEAFAARATDFASKNVARAYRAYTAALRAANGVDFDDLLMLTARVLSRDAAVRAECQARWRHLLVDEYQDTNHAQFIIASMIAGEGSGTSAVPAESVGAGGRNSAGTAEVPGAVEGPNICVVGDPDQSIYGWRGADIANIMEFEDKYPGCRVITLGENFRSTAPILAAADTLIRHNRRRKHKDLFTSRKGGELPEAVLCRDERHEATLTYDWLKARHEAGVAWRDMAVFYRTNSLSRVMEDALRAGGVPYTIARGTAFYEREEVRNALAYLRVVANPADGVSLSRIVNTPARGIGKTSLESVEAFSDQHAITLLNALHQAGTIAGLNPRATAAIAKFTGLIDAWASGGALMGAAGDASLPGLVDRVIEESGLRTMYKAQAAASKSDSDEQRVDNLDELVSSARQFELEYQPDVLGASDVGASAVPAEPESSPALLPLLRAYLESVALVADADAVDPENGTVTLMTLHAAKGLEFDSVAMIGMEEGLLPHSRAVSMPVGGDAELEEERRLCFVGITRSMRRLLMTSAKYRTIRGISDRTIPSRFLAEIPAEAMKVSDQTAWDDEDDFVSGGSGSAPAAAPVPFPVGATVRHPQFGVGTVQSIESGRNARATVKFREVGTKTLVLEYARLTQL